MFKGHIPKHAFCLWVACHHRHPTHDRIIAWKHDPPDFKCSLCLSCMDSHSHLFFECVYSKEVWDGVLVATDWHDFPTSWGDIVGPISSSAPPRLIQRLALAGTVYMVWQERNRRIFTNDKRPPIVLIKEILSTIRMKVEWELKRKRISNEDVGA